MKKLISIILTACICLSLLGGVSFAGAETAETNITYFFSSKDSNLTSYADGTQIHKISEPSNWSFGGAVVDGKTDTGANFQLKTAGYVLCKTAAKNDYLSIVIDVPVAGKYVLDYSYFQNYGSNQPRGGYGNVYLVKGELNATQIAEELNQSGNKYFSDIQYFSDATSTSWGNSTSGRFVDFAVGKYTLIFSVSEKSEEINTTEQGQTFRMWPSSLTLVPVSEKTYTFDKDLINADSWNSDYIGNYANTIVPVKDYGTHGYKYFDADNDTYTNVETSVTALQFSGSGYFRLRSYVADMFNNVDGAKLALAFKRPYDSPSFYSVNVLPSSQSDNTATTAEFFAENISATKTTVEDYTISASNIGGTHSLSEQVNKDYDLGELVYCNGETDLVISFFTGAAGEDGTGKNMRISSLTLTPVDVSSITLDALTTLTVDETSTVKVMAGEKSVVDSFVTYESNNTSVATVAADGTVTAKAAGNATITATVGELSATATITVTVPAEEPEDEPEAVPTEIKYGVFVNEKACATDVTANGVALNEATGLVNGTLNQGETLTAIAKDEASGYKFRYWVLGSAATGRYYSSEKTVTVKPYANIALTAIYTVANDEARVVDLFNYNGEFLQTLTNLGDLANVKPTMIGHTFDNKWLIDKTTELTTTTDLTTPVTQAVAQYRKNSGYETEKVNEDSTYGWTRNGKLVTYDADYTFLTWLNGDAAIEKNTEEISDKIPLAVLESNGSAYMLEYDKGEYEVVEAGILFGSTDSIDVKSAYSKAMVKRLEENGGHGQMTATSMGTANETYARGYVMYKDKNDKIKVIYSK